METKNYRRVTLRSSIKIKFDSAAEAPTLSFKLKRSGANPIISSLRRAASPQSEQLQKLRSAKYIFIPRVKTIYSNFSRAERYETGSVQELYFSNR